MKKYPMPHKRVNDSPGPSSFKSCLRRSPSHSFLLQRSAAVLSGIMTVSIIYFLLVFPIRLTALDPSKPISRYLLDQWGLKSGLPTDLVFSIAQTPDGYIWIGTVKGLFRFDGLEIEQIPLPLSQKGAPLSINALQADRFNKGGLWIGSHQGLLYLNNSVLTHYYSEKADGPKRTLIPTLFQDSGGAVWVGTYKHGLLRYKDGVFKSYTQKEGIPQSSTIQSVTEDSHGVIWISAVGDGLYRGRPDNFEKFHLNTADMKPPPNRTKNYSVYTAREARRGIMWLGTNIGLIGVDNKDIENIKTLHHFTRENGLIDNNITDIYEDTHGSLWIGTDNGYNRIKFLRSDETEIDSIEQWKPGITGKFIWEDKEENMWFGTYGWGLKRLKDATFFMHESLDGTPAYFPGIYRERNGRIWVGSNLGNVYRFNPRTEAFQKVMQLGTDNESKITAIEKGPTGRWWFGTKGKGIIISKENGTRRRTFTTDDGLNDNTITIIFRDSRDRMWIGTTYKGVNCFENGRMHSLKESNGLTGNYVNTITEDSEQNIWIGTHQGVTVVEGGGLPTENTRTYFPDNLITNIYEDKINPGVFWIGTYGNGLMRFRDNQWISYTHKEGLAYDTVLSIVEDQFGFFWLSSHDGIFRVNKQDLEAIARGEHRPLTSTVFGVSDGLKSPICRVISNNATAITETGEFWFSTARGIAVTNPANRFINKCPPSVVLKDAIFNYDPVSKEQPAETNENVFTGIKDIRFNFTVPTFVSPEKVIIKYKLEGHDRDWQTIRHPQPRTAHYRDIPPGQYRFHVTAANNSGIWNNTGADFKFTLKPHFYQYALFKVSISLLGFFLVAASYIGLKRYLYMRKLKNKYKNSTLDPEKAEKYLARLMGLMKTDKVYRDETITLNTLAEQMSIHHRYLSQLINEQLNKNFRDFLNGYRIEDAKKMLREDSERNYSMLGIALEVGFNSKEVFNRTFKKLTGMTPTEYRKSVSA